MDMAWAAEPGCSHGHGGDRDVCSLSSTGGAFQGEDPVCLSFSELQFIFIYSSENSQFLQFRLNPRFKKLFISCRPEILLRVIFSFFSLPASHL